MKDLYKILGVSEDADETTIKKAYRKLAKENHPDATGGDKKRTERFKEVNEAYAVLGEKDKRVEYDRLRRAPVGADGMPQGFDAEAFAQAFGRGGRPGAGGVTFEGGFDLNDLFSSLFGDRQAPFGDARRGAGPRQARGADVSGVLELSFADAALGTKRTVRTGTSDGTVEVSVPGGVETGGRLRVPGKGAAARSQGTPGDLYLEVHVRPDPFLTRQDDDVLVDVPVSVTEAALGAKVGVPTVEGSVTVTIPPGTSSGAKLRLRGKGVRRRDGTRGDQICRVEIVVPKKATDDPELKRLFEEIGKRTAGVRVRPF